MDFSGNRAEISEEFNKKVFKILDRLGKIAEPFGKSFIINKLSIVTIP